MAAEASRSSGSADSYVGSLISLTSKSEIRYEGILFNVNTEEASIGLRNVRSFGTEGRRKDGQQVPASDKVYEYIVFRGSDIKDLQVKSSPPVQTAPSIHNDPAIIQSHYTAPTTTSTSTLPTLTGPISDFSGQVSQPGVPRPTYQSSVPLYQPGGSLASWSPSTPPTTNGSGLSVPMYWQGYYGPSGALQTQQQSLLQPAQGLSMPPPVQPHLQPPSVQPPVQYPTMNSSLPAGLSSVPAPKLSDSSNMMLYKAPAQALPAASQSIDSPLVSTGLSNVLDKNTVASLVPNLAKSVPTMPFNSLSEHLSTGGGMLNSPALVTPGQFLQPGPTISQTSQMAQKDVEVVQDPPPAVAMPVSSEAQAPLLPLPSSSNPELNGVTSHPRYINRGGRARGRGNEFSGPVTNFTEEFDFEAMNEKFRKDEVWGHLGKNKAQHDDGLIPEEEDDVDVPNIDMKTVYKKDDFFDTLSCNALDRQSRDGRPRFSEQMRLDTETFGDFPRNRGFRGGRGPGRGPGRGGWSRGGYYGRGYGYVGRGRGHSVYRA